MTKLRSHSTTRPGIALRASFATVATAALVAVGLTVPLAASADPAAPTPTASFGVGTYSGVVPDGVCSVQTVVTGGAGGRAAAGANGVGSNGAGARITASFAVHPGQAFAGSVGGGGKTNSGRTGGAGGANGGGAGGTAVTDHGGAGGGGRSTFTVDGAELVVAGGGGGSGGGHSTTDRGFGGDAGLPIVAGTVAGADGTAGTDAPGITPGGGQGGQPSAPGAGGVNSTSPALNGVAGSAQAGGAGGTDPNYDAGGGGGAGAYGAGGGASTTIRNEEVVNGSTIRGVAGGGGGGGASSVASSVVAGSVNSVAIGRQTGTGAGADGSVTLAWVPCEYDLAVVKSASVSPAGPTATVAPVGSTITWTIAVTNNGPDAMTRGDLLTLTDGLPGTGAKTITSIGVSGGSNSTLVSGPVACDAAVGDAMPTTLECDRSYQPVGGTASGLRGLDVGETFTVSYSQTVTAADAAGLSNTAGVTDRVTGDTNDSSTVVLDVVTGPAADDDEDLGNPLGSTVTVSVLDNDTVDAGPAVVRLLDGTTPVTELEVPGQGVWTVVGDDVVFTPENGFLGDPDPVDYRITDANGLTATATVTVGYVPEAVDDEDLGNALGTTVTVDVLANDTGDWQSGSVRLVDPDSGARVTTLTVPGEGRWDVVGDDVVFTPENGFLLDPNPVDYEVTDTTGDTVRATVIVGYVPEASDDEDLGNTMGDAVTLDVLDNDSGDWNVASVRLIDPANGARVTTLTVPGEGTWTVSATTGEVTFTPEAGYEGNPTDVDYEVTDVTGDTVSASIHVTYLPVATDDEDHGNTIGDAVTVDVLGNDDGVLDPTTVTLIDPDSGARVTELVVPGEGRWSVDPMTGQVTFTPESGYPGNPTPVRYEVTDTIGQKADAEIVITYLPESTDDVSTGHTPGTPVTVDILGNDRGDFDPSTARLIDPSTGDRVTRLTVPGEGVWTVDPVTGAATFTPQNGFMGDPTPVRYEVSDLRGNPTVSLITIRYLPSLASTGADVVAPFAGALLALLLGAAAIVIARRRRA